MVDIGSGKNLYAAKIAKKIIGQFLKYNDVDRHILILVNALIQSFIIHDESMRKCVGGLFIGLQIDEKGIQWQKDTSYILYEDIFNDPTLINVLVKDGVVGISSPHRSRTYYTTSTNHSQESLRKWWHENKEEIGKYFISCESKYFVFISKKYRLINLVFDYVNEEKKLFSMNTSGPNKLDVQVNKELMESLLLEPKDFPNNPIPMQMKWF